MDFSTLYKSKEIVRGEFKITLKELSVQKMRAVEIEMKKDRHKGLALGLYYASNELITEEDYNAMPSSLQMELLDAYNTLNVPESVLEKIAKNLPGPTAL